MTAPLALADAIDPRIWHKAGPGLVWAPTTQDLIAASDFIRRHSNPPAEVAEVVRQVTAAITAPLDLRGDRYLFAEEIMSLLRERAEDAATLLESLSTTKLKGPAA